MTDAIDSATRVACEEKRSGDGPRVEVVEDALCSESELRRAVVAGAVTSGIVCAIAGVGLGYWLASRGGKD